MEVKVGQIWRHIHTERDWKVVFVGRYDATLADEEGTFSDGLWKFEKGIYAIVSDSPLSDLEIVQKALSTVGEYGGSLLFQDDGSCCITESPLVGYDNAIMFFNSSKDLLMWAKQTMTWR